MGGIETPSTAPINWLLYKTPSKLFKNFKTNDRINKKDFEYMNK
jgi:hypothetical protein